MNKLIAALAGALAIAGVAHAAPKNAATDDARAAAALDTAYQAAVKANDAAAALPPT